MPNILATIRLAIGNVGWYDPLTNIHLTLSRPFAHIYEGMNVTNVKRGVEYKTVMVVDGDLSPSLSTLSKAKIDNTPELDFIKEVTTNTQETFVESNKLEEAPTVKEVLETVSEDTPKEEAKEIKEAPEKPKRKSKKSKEVIKEDK